MVVFGLGHVLRSPAVIFLGCLLPFPKLRQGCLSHTSQGATQHSTARPSHPIKEGFLGPESLGRTRLASHMIAMEALARDQDQEQPQEAEEQAGPYPIEQLQVSTPVPVMCSVSEHITCI